MKEKNNQKVLLGMSGGVDSSVAGYILKREGFEVIGANIQLYSTNHNTWCKTTQSEDAKKIAKSLDIPFYNFNMQKEFKKHVIEYFVKEYESGRTPNPCVICNRYVKFQALLDKAQQLGIEYIATGHYAKIYYKKNRYLLAKGKDKTKDQSYFLYRLTQKQLSKTVFPLGNYKKTDIKKYAKELGLEIADKPESQEICFIQDNNHYEFVKRYSKEKQSKGEIVNTSGKVVGEHKGIAKYTIGQRKGVGVSFGKPMYVVDIDAEKNRIVVGQQDLLLKDELVAKDLNWIGIVNLEKEMKVNAKIRYQAKGQSAKIVPLENGNVRVIFKKKQRAITKGQSVVFYKNDIVIGGGIIT